MPAVTLSTIQIEIPSGPWGANRLIDVSPRAADELDMKHSGIVRVSVEPVAAAAAAQAD